MTLWQELKHQYNHFLQDFSYHHGLARNLGQPKLHCIELTNHCNIRCVMCPRGEPNMMTRPEGNMSVDLFKKVLSELRYFSDPSWFQLFGEPLLNPCFFEQVALAKREKKILKLGVSTNATLLNQSNSEKILKSKLDVLMIAIDGTNKEVYESIRKSEHYTYEEVVANAEEFLSMRKRMAKKTPHVQLSIIVMDKTAPELESFRQFWMEKGANEVVFKRFVNWANQSNVSDIAGLSKSLNQSTNPDYPCKLLWESMVITWDGKVVCCCFDYDTVMPMGDLKVQTLKEIWNSPAYQKLRKQERSGRNASILCANCTQAPGHARNPHYPFKWSRV